MSTGLDIPRGAQSGKEASSQGSVSFWIFENSVFLCFFIDFLQELPESSHQP